MSKDACFNACNSPTVSTIEGQPVCAACFDHYMGYDKPTPSTPDYVTADVAVDLRGF